MSRADGRPTQPALDQVGRLLRLVPYLNRHGSVPLDRAAADLGVPREQLDSDLRVLFMCGLPGGYPDDLIDVDLEALEDEGVVRVSNADYLSRPLRLQPTEAAALVVALRSLRTDADVETREVLDRVLAKLEVAAGGAARLVDAGEETEPAGSVETRATLRRAIEAGRQLRLTYLVPARDEQSERVVDPDSLVTDHGHDYLGAWCHRAEAPRWFRLDRIAAAELLDTPVERPDQGPPPPERGDGVFSPSPDALAVTLHLAPEARWVPEYYQVDEVRPRPDGSLEVDLHVADERWLRRTLLRLAPAVTVVRPPEFTEMFTADLTSVEGLYSEHDVE